VKAVRRDSWAPSTRSVLCSVHFAEECFDRTFCNITKLHRDAVPTIFPAFPAHLQKVSFLDVDSKLTCDCRTCCHGNGSREKDDVYW
jgi:hypothetical protein